MEHAKLLVHRGATYVDREQLATIEPPPATPTWKPIKHAFFVDTIHDELARRNISVSDERYAVQRKGHYLFGVMVLNYLQTTEFAAALAFRHANDMSEAIKMYAGLRVFACDNMALSGDEIILHRKHTPRLSLADALSEAFDRYHNGDGALMLQRYVEDLKRATLSSRAASQYVFDIFGKKIVPIRLFHPVINDWYAKYPHKDDIGTEWGLLNCFTAHTKKLPPGPQMRATVRLGKYFGLGKPEPLPQ